MESLAAKPGHVRMAPLVSLTSESDEGHDFRQDYKDPLGCEHSHAACGEKKYAAIFVGLRRLFALGECNTHL